MAAILREGLPYVHLIARELALIVATDITLVALMGLNELTLSRHTYLRTDGKHVPCRTLRMVGNAIAGLALRLD